MALQEVSSLRSVDVILPDAQLPGSATSIQLSHVNRILRDGEVISETIHRRAFMAAEDPATLQSVIGEVATGLASDNGSLQVALDQSNAALGESRLESDSLRAENADLRMQLEAAQATVQRHEAAMATVEPPQDPEQEA